MKDKKQFRHHPDGWIYINDLQIPLEDFVKENKDYKLPNGWIGQEYMRGEFHRFYDGTNEEFVDKEWKEGDEYIGQHDKWARVLEKKNKVVSQDR